MTVFRRNAFLDPAASAGLPSDGSITQVLFVDARAPDAAALLDATQPGQAAFLIDAGLDGLKQAAHILSLHDLGDLSAVDLIGHGGAGGLSLGAASLDDAALSDRAADLALIGQSLSSHGDLSLYATAGVGHAGTGLEFVADLTLATTPHAAPAATPDLSPSHDEHVESAAISHPFETDTMAGGSTPQSVATAGDPDVFILSTDNDDRNALQSVSDTGSYPDNGVTTFFSGQSEEPSALNNANAERVALDPLNNDYVIEGNTNGKNEIVLGSLSGLNTSSTESLTAIYSDSAPNQMNLDGSTQPGDIEALALDPVNREVYFTEGDQFKEVGYGGGAATVLGTATYAADSPNYLIGMALDTTDHTAYFDATHEVVTTVRTPGGGFKTKKGGTTHLSGTNGIYTTTVKNALWKAPNILASGQSLTQLPLNGLPGKIQDIAIDPTHHYLYITTQSASGSAAGIYQYALTNNGGGSVTTVYQQTGAIPGLLGNIVVDANGQYYVTVEDGSNPGAVYVGSTSGGAPHLLYTVPTTVNDGGASTTEPSDVAVDLAPTLSLPAATTTQPIQGGSAVQVLAGLVTAADPDGAGDLAGATVSIGSGFKSGDALAATVTGAITASYNSTTGVLTLTGAGSYAQYDQVLESVTYQDGATESAAHPTRVVDFTITDGLVSSTTETINLTLDHAPVAYPVSNTAVVGGGAVTGNVLTTATDPDGDALSLASGADLTGQYGSLTLNSNGTYSYTPDASITAPTGSHPADVFNYTATDGHGATATSTLTFTLDRAPVVQNLSLTVTAGATGSADAAHGLLSTAAASDPDGDGLTITAIDGVGAYVGQTESGSNGTVTVNADGSYSFTAAADPSGPTGSPVTELATFTVSDGHGGFTTADLTVTIDRAPAGVSQTPAVDDGAPFGGNALTGASDPDTSSTTFSVTQVTPAGGMTSAVAANGTTTVSGTYGDLVIGANGAYTYTDGATPGEQSALAGVTGSHPVDSFTVTLADTNGPATGTETLSFTIDRAPVLAAGATVDYTEGATAAATDGGLTVSDADGDAIASAAVSIVGGFVSGDVLSAVGAAGYGIDASYDAATGVLSLSNATTAAAYQSVLDGVAFSTVSETVAAHEAAAGADETRTLDYTASDGTLGSVVATSTVDVGIVIADTAAHIASALDTLNGDASITAIQVTDGAALTITVAQFTGDGAALGLVTGESGIVVADTAADISAGLDALNTGASLTDIQITDGQPLTISYAQYLNDTTALGLIAGAHQVDVSDITGRSYDAEDVSYDASGNVTSKTYFGLSGGDHKIEDFNVSTGQVTEQIFYNAQDVVLADWTFAYSQDGSYVLTGDDFSPARAYGSVAQSYDSSGVLTSAVYSDYKNEPYSTITVDYAANGEQTSATYSGYAANAPYQTAVRAYDSSGVLTSITYTGFSHEAYTELAANYNTDGTLKNEVFSGFTGAYASVTETFDTQGRHLTYVYENTSSQVVEDVSVAYNNDGSYTLTGSNITGQSYTGFLSDYSSKGELISKAVYEASGGEHDIGYAAGASFATDGSTQVVSLVDGDVVSIGAGLGHVRISGYSPAGDNETFDVSTAVFTDFDELLAHAHASGANTVVDAGASGLIEFTGVTLAQLTQHGSDFHFP